MTTELQNEGGNRVIDYITLILWYVDYGKHVICLGLKQGITFCSSVEIKIIIS